MGTQAVPAGGTSGGVPMDEKLVLDWTKKEQALGAVRQAIKVTLDQGLTEVYDEPPFNQKCNGGFRHIFAAYQSGPQGIYTAA